MKNVAGRKEVLGISERLACKAVGLARATYRRSRLAETPPTHVNGQVEVSVGGRIEVSTPCGSS
jgi:hypothetical protein